MPRRSHKKSRLGCSECKRRHLKCDESKPKCVNCSTAKIKCPYERHHKAHDDEALTPASSTPDAPSSSTTLAASPNRPIPSPLSFNFDNAVNVSDLNMLHLELLYYWFSEIHQTFSVIPDTARLYCDLTIKYGLQFPFLMRQLLASSALYMSISRPDRREFYHREAAKLQSEALRGFMAGLDTMTQDNVIPMFLCSSLVGLHDFCDTFSSRAGNFGKVLDSLLGSIRLLRGIKSVIGSWWPVLLSSELSPILVTAHYAHEQGVKAKHDLPVLRHMVAEADIGQSSRDAYNDTITELERVFSVQMKFLPGGENGQNMATNMTFAWFVTSSAKYIALVSERRPEALVILAYFAALLHRRRDFWAIGDAGSYLVNGIDEYLGPGWNQWLSWPKAFIREEL